MKQTITHHGNVLRLVLAYAAPARETVDDWVRFCQKAAEEAATAVRENPPGTDQLTAIWQWEKEQKAAGRPIMPRPDKVPMTGSELEAAAQFAAVAAYRESMPLLTGRRRAQAYIACIAAGVQFGYIQPSELKTMFYAAQMALQAHSKRNRDAGSRRKRPQPHPIGRRAGGDQGAEVGE